MSKSFEVEGQIHSIGETTEYGNNGFTKREFVLKLTGPDENPKFPNHIALELIKDKCALMDAYNIGDELKVTFNLSGRLWQRDDGPEKCFTSLQAWRIEAGGAGAGNDMGGSQAQGQYDEYDQGGFSGDDIPF